MLDRRRTPLLTSALTLLLALPALAQTGRVTGAVKDATGGTVPA